MPTLPTPREQAERLIELGVLDLAGLPAGRLRNMTNGFRSEGALVVVHPDLVRASALIPLLRVNGRQGFVVSDMSDVDVFAPISAVTLPDTPVYLVHDIDRGDAMANWSPDEALPAIGRALDARTPALWISNGTGRDGAANRNAPKVGWCWAGNRHTWLGFASAAHRSPLRG